MEETIKLKIKDAIFLILLLGAIIGLFSAIITIRQYGVMLSNPLGYSMEKWGYNTCTCYDMEGKVIPIKSIKYNKTADLNPFEVEYGPSVDYSNIKIGDINGTGRYT